jgi:phosphatidylserine decarboxylase
MNLSALKRKQNRVDSGFDSRGIILIKSIWVHLTQSVPQRALTALAGQFAKRRLGRLTSWVIRRFILFYGVNMQEAEQSDYLHYKTFNEFFTRKLRQGVRPIDLQEDALVSPVDGVCGSQGWIRHGSLFQAKGRMYTLRSLLAVGEKSVKEFLNGNFMTYYLSPKDYHRVHMPFAGTLERVSWIPGKLYSVNPSVVEHVDSVFAKNERVVCLFHTASGKMAVIFVGAMIVGSVTLPWQCAMRSADRSVTHWDYRGKQLRFSKGQEIGNFELGSTVIVLTQKDAFSQSVLQEGDAVKMGQMVARVSASQN